MTADRGAHIADAGTCPTCGKLRWLTRADAKRVSRRIKGRKGRLHAYQCGEYWHVGHPPSSLVRGVITREDVRAAPRPPRNILEEDTRPY